MLYSCVSCDAAVVPPKRARTREEKLQRNIATHPLLPPCRDCLRRCWEKVAEEQRKLIWQSFWKLEKHGRDIFVYSSIEVSEPAGFKPDAVHNRAYVIAYKLTDAMGRQHRVCRTFFLATLGYKATASYVNELVRKTPIGSPVPVPDGCGRFGPPSSIDRDGIIAHIRSFNPFLPHYRRSHAPKRLYLPPELSIRFMVNDYNDRNPRATVSYNTYRREVNKLNISFARLSKEECELCKTLSLSHSKILGTRNCIEDCEACARQREHDELKMEARKVYQEDGEHFSEDLIVRSVDMQKVIMLPLMPGVKSTNFTKRVLVFHETFAPVGKYKAATPTLSYLWHEGIAGRGAEDISSAFIHALREDRDKSHIVYFTDNCSSQNKNWILFSQLASLINSDEVSAETITLKFLEAGHTFMSADSIHADVEKRMKAMKDICDFNDFQNCVQHHNIRAIALKCTDFYRLQSRKSIAKLKRARVQISEMRVVQFRRREHSLFYKIRHSDEEFTTVDFLLTKCKLPMELKTSHDGDRGIPPAKKRRILKNLVPLMPTTRAQFWHDIATNENVKDLLSETEDETDEMR